MVVQLVYLFNFRSLQQSDFALGLLTNRWTIFGALGMLGAQVFFTYAPVMNNLFHTVPIAAASWLRIASVAAIIFLVVEFEKWIRFGGGRGDTEQKVTRFRRQSSVGNRQGLVSNPARESVSMDNDMRASQTVIKNGRLSAFWAPRFCVALRSIVVAPAWRKASSGCCDSDDSNEVGVNRAPCCCDGQSRPEKRIPLKKRDYSAGARVSPATWLRFGCPGRVASVAARCLPMLGMY